MMAVIVNVPNNFTVYLLTKFWFWEWNRFGQSIEELVQLRSSAGSGKKKSWKDWWALAVGSAIIINQLDGKSNLISCCPYACRSLVDQSKKPYNGKPKYKFNNEHQASKKPNRLLAVCKSCAWALAASLFVMDFCN